MDCAAEAPLVIGGGLSSRQQQQPAGVLDGPELPEDGLDKDRKAVARDLKPVYRAVNAEAAEQALQAFDEAWGERYPMIAAS